MYLTNFSASTAGIISCAGLFAQSLPLPSDDFSGICIAKSSSNEEVLSRGISNPESAWNNDENSIYPMNPIMDPFIKMLCLSLIKQGKVKLDAPLKTYLNGIPEPMASDIQIKHLLLHQSGLPELPPSDLFNPKNIEKQDPFKLAELVSHQTPVDSLKNKFSFSNSNTYLLLAVLESASEKPIDELVEVELFDKLGMKRSRLRLPGKGREEAVKSSFTESDPNKEETSNERLSDKYYSSIYAACRLVPEEVNPNSTEYKMAILSSQQFPEDSSIRSYITALDFHRMMQSALFDDNFLSEDLKLIFINAYSSETPYRDFEQFKSLGYLQMDFNYKGLNLEYRYSAKDNYSVVLLSNGNPTASMDYLKLLETHFRQ